jgi:hypothetical protein
MQDIMRFNHKEPRRDIWADYDPKKAIEGIRKSRGALKGVDIVALQRIFVINEARTVRGGLRKLRCWHFACSCVTPVNPLVSLI